MSECVPTQKRTRKPRGYWSDPENVLREVRAWHARHGGPFPTQGRMHATGDSALAAAIQTTLGGFRKLREAVGEGQARVAAGHWDDVDVVLADVRRWREAHDGAFPTQTKLEATGFGGLAGAIAAHGGYRWLRERLGEAEKPPPKPSGHWDDFENVRAALLAYKREHGRFPGVNALNGGGHTALASAIMRKHRGMEAVRKRMGEERACKPRGYWSNFENVRTVLDQYRQVHGRLPTSDQLCEMGLKSVSQAIEKNHGGFANARIRMGEPPPTRQRKPRGHWTVAANVYAVIQEWIDAHDGRFPNTRDLSDAYGSPIVTAIYAHHGGLDAMRAGMGRMPVSDQMLEEHADVLIAAVVALNTPDTMGLWARICGRWTERQLREAAAAFRASGSLDAFRALAAD